MLEFLAVVLNFRGSREVVVAAVCPDTARLRHVGATDRNDGGEAGTLGSSSERPSHAGCSSGRRVFALLLRPQETEEKVRSRSPTC